MKSVFDFGKYITQIRELPYADEKSLFLDVVFLSYQAGASNNNSKILKKSFYFINYNHQAYYYQKMNIEELEQLYDSFINGNKNIDQEVPDVAIQFNSGFLQFQSSYIEENDKIIEKDEQNIKIKQEHNKKENKQRIIITEISNIQLNDQCKQSIDPQIQDQKQNKNKIDQNNQKILEIPIPQIKEIKQFSVEQSKQIMKKQYEEYRRQEQFKSNCFQQSNQRSQIIGKTKCIICLENIQSNRYLLTACQHIYHKNCLNNLIEAQVDLPIRCPNLQCRQEILREDLEQITSKQVMDKLDKFAFNQYLMSHPNIFQCPTQNCSGIYEIEGPIQVCMICQQIFCTKCKKLFHEGICGEQSFVDLARRQQYKQCSLCNRWIEKTYGCNHISCPCGHEFCYECGKQWVKGMECRCIETQQNQQIETQQEIQQQQVYQQEPLQQNQTHSQNNQTYVQHARNIFETVQTFFKTNQPQFLNTDDLFKNFGLSYITRIKR
ncbi:unnamed protein product [Paramecium primaurelia]|uniref:RBR-type E3 ubiquitin transferase n=1 Tax=Paramecium primaurelia TaxID=5886 RepID=A0A8S1K292_PARPR|nr:unnamed protein product [Paramecium primaurelia]